MRIGKKDWISVKVNKDTYDKLKNYKDKVGIPITTTIDKAVEEYLKNKEK